MFLNATIPSHLVCMLSQLYRTELLSPTMVLFSKVSVTQSQLQSENIKWKDSRIHNSHFKLHDALRGAA